MMHALPGAATTSAGAMNVISALLEQRTGQQIAANRAYRIDSTLKPLLRELELTSLDQLVVHLVKSRNGGLGDRVVDALLNQETSFFRDAMVLDQVADAAEALQAEIPYRRLRVWSAGCSRGQEPLSLAMLLAERGFSALGSFELVATDVSSSALARARAGRYSQFEIQRGLPVRRMMQWFDNVDGEWAAKSELLRRIQFRQQNLAADPPPPPGKFDLLLCRNVLLYFSQPLRQRVFSLFADAVRPGGLLVLGAGETVIGQTSAFQPSDRFRGFYQQVGGGSAD